MKNKVLIGLFLCLFLLVGFFVLDFDYKVITNNVDSIVFEAGSYDGELSVGTYTSYDNHTITVNEDGTVLYDNTYKLTVTASDKGYTLTGKIGTNKKSVTFYQVNDSSIISNTTVNYTHNDATVYLYDYTGFKLNVTPVVNSEGIFELYHDGVKVNNYTDLQSAIDAAGNGDTVKITEDYKVTSGVLVNKMLIIDGLNHILNRSEWNNGVFVIADNGELTLKNVTIDGGATNFEIDFDSVTFKDYYIPLKAGTLEKDPRLTLSAVIVRGKLTTDNVKINNNYTSSNGAAMHVVNGSVTLKNSTFNHNFGNTYGGAINIGSILNGRVTYPVTSVVIDNCKFNDNYVANSNNVSKFGVGHGGAVNVMNTTKVEINSSEFKGNVAYYGKGGALDFRDEQTLKEIPADTLGLDFIQATIKDTLFENNWAGNDGFAIQSYAADLYVDGCTFRKNIGTHPTSSVGTVSVESYRKNMRIYSSIKNTLFEENIGPASVFGDHSSLIDADFENVTFKGNSGNESILLYSATSNFKNCKFINEDVVYGVLDARIYENHEIPPSMTLDNVTFEGTNGATDLIIRKNKHNMELNDYKVILKGKTEGNIDVWDDNSLTITGSHTGRIESDGLTKGESIVLDEGSEVIGQMVVNYETYTLTIQYPNDFEKNADHLYLEKDKTYTPAELYLLTYVEKEGKMIKYYTDSAYTTPWDYKVSNNMTVYGTWEDHSHEFVGNYIVHNNVIYDQCACGALGHQLSLEVPENLFYNGKAKVVTVNNELKLEGYTLKYQVKDKEGNYVDMEGVPTKIGDYQAVLMYEDLTITKEYSIMEKVVNPSTGLSNPYVLLGIVLSSSIVLYIVNRRKKYL